MGLKPINNPIVHSRLLLKVSFYFVSYFERRSFGWSCGRSSLLGIPNQNKEMRCFFKLGTVELQDKKKTTIKYDTNIQFSSPFVKGGLVGFVSKSQENGVTWS